MSPTLSHALFPLPRSLALAVTAHHDLHLIARQLRAHLEMLRDSGITALPTTPQALRDPWEAHTATLRSRNLKQAATALRSAAPQVQEAAPPAPADTKRQAPSFDAPKPAPLPASKPAASTPLWTTLGARPQERSGSLSALPPAAAAPPRAPTSSQAPPDPRLQEAVAARSHVPELKPAGSAQTPSLFDEEPDDLTHDPSRVSAPLPGFDHTDSLRTKVKTLDPQEKLDFLRQCLGDCTACPLHQGRKNIVFGEGNPQADVVFVGEGPGYHEDHQGRPFVGKSGELLTRMISAMGIAREEVYIANVVKCRPPENRDPRPDEILKCSPYLYKQLEAVNPRAIVTLGRPATQTLLQSQEPMHKLRGRWQDWRQIPVLPTYHPAYLLRNEQKKRDVWQDLQLVMRVLGLGR